MSVTEFILLIFMTYNGEIFTQVDEHKFLKESACDSHAIDEAIPEIEQGSPSGAQFRHICLPITTESV